MTGNTLTQTEIDHYLETVPTLQWLSDRKKTMTKHCVQFNILVRNFLHTFFCCNRFDIFFLSSGHRNKQRINFAR